MYNRSKRIWNASELNELAAARGIKAESSCERAKISNEFYKRY